MDRAKLKIFNILFVYCSITFLVIALYKSKYFYIPNIYSCWPIVAAIFFMCVGIFCHALAWRRILYISSFPVSLQKAVISIGATIFGKYIPGKIWMILGRSFIIAQYHAFPAGKISSISMYAQMLSIWVGLIVGFIGLLPLIVIQDWISFLFVFILLFSLVLFTGFFQKVMQWLLPEKVYEKISLVRFTSFQILGLLPWFCLSWFFYFLGFYFLVNGIIDSTVSIMVGFAFLFSASIGIIAFIFPGGLGIREGLIVGILVLTGLSKLDAITIAVASRLWFLFGEIFIFLLATVLKKAKD